ncbi:MULTISPECIES: hypothetical protein [unclassified Rathayibacter]|uniref:hypothetical protein n=1 Tax=unclassified Rathayibacter TaxID=2609250 RepID=UPI000CE8260A|nr:MULTISPECIES: hypothetical protein [unclassified Rathayibacter]PPG80259.1 hypothetical protein C5C52_10920 [Rathayibacter sp. AY1E5]PPH34300.1 hypothetical protein C5C94_00675 [Rathayibacter sp. AY1C3]PPI32480.1 hypothetical protein C5D66_04680 [Rathayibacter sp. AY1B4]
MQDRHDQEPPERSRTAEQHWGPADSLFPRLHRQSSLLAAAEAVAQVDGPGPGDVWSRLLHDYAHASDRVVSVDGDAEAATLGWLKPRGVVSLLVTERCDDDAAAEHLVAALAAMNAVTLSVHEARAVRLRPLLDVLHRLLPDAFAELPVDRSAHYPAGTAIAVLAPGVLYRDWAPPQALAGPAHDDDDRLAMLTLYGRIRQLDVRPS